MTAIVAPTTDTALAAILAELREVKEELLQLREVKIELQQLKVTVRRKVADPVESLTVKEAAERLRCSTRTIERYLARRLFTDARTEKVSGSPWKLFSDELEEFRIRGEDGLALFRQRMDRLA